MSFFNQLGKIVANPGMLTAPEAAKADRTAYLTQLEASKAEIERQISGMLTELGKAYYENHVDDRQTEYETQLAAIRAAYGDIAKYDKQAQEIEDRRRCPDCGAELMEGSMFCNICGAKLQDAPDSAQAQAQRLCPNCNAVLKSDDIFCTYCGADLRK